MIELRPRTLPLLMIGITFLGETAIADDAPRGTAVDQMRTLAEQTSVWVDGQTASARAAERVSQPVFRYSDEPRNIHDATLWVWMHEARPVALQKIEDSQHLATGEERWTYCLTSLSTETIQVEWPDGREFSSSAPGLTFAPVPDSMRVASTSAARKRQLRQLSREFAATILIDPRNDEKLEMRLLPRPILEFHETKSELPVGAIFGFATHGTNPDLLLVIELRADDSGDALWQFAAARMTTGGLTLRHDDVPVWEAEWVRPVGRPLETWTFFFVPRDAD